LLQKGINLLLLLLVVGNNVKLRHGTLESCSTGLNLPIGVVKSKAPKIKSEELNAQWDVEYWTRMFEDEVNVFDGMIEEFNELVERG